jgi:hypothetical protein
VTSLNRASLSGSGARPSLIVLGQLGTYTPVRPGALAEGDVILYSNSAFYVVRRMGQVHGTGYITLRELVTNAISTVRIEPKVRVTRLDVSRLVTANFEGRWEGWKVSTGDVVFYPDLHVVAIRHSRGWFRTAAPWTPFADAEVIHDVLLKRALMVRSNIRNSGVDPGAEFVIGSVVASRDIRLSEPSVWFRQAEDYWVGNSRQAPLSDQMIRYELSRQTYQVLRLPEAT